MPSSATVKKPIFLSFILTHLPVALRRKHPKPSRNKFYIKSSAGFTPKIDQARSEI